MSFPPRSDLHLSVPIDPIPCLSVLDGTTSSAATPEASPTGTAPHLPTITLPDRLRSFLDTRTELPRSHLRSIGHTSPRCPLCCFLMSHRPVSFHGPGSSQTIRSILHFHVECFRYTRTCYQFSDHEPITTSIQHLLCSLQPWHIPTHGFASPPLRSSFSHGVNSDPTLLTLVPRNLNLELYAVVPPDRNPIQPRSSPAKSRHSTI